jgi:glutamine amidotransferase
MIVIVDYDMGNVKSIMNMLKKLGIQNVITRDKKAILSADKLILPGVGAFDAAMAHLQHYDLIDVLNTKVLEQRAPVLGICIGMQIMAKNSAEGEQPGLGWINAEVKKFEPSLTVNQKKLPIPHMGWNYIQTVTPNLLFKDLENKSRFYFIHSYHMVCTEQTDILATTEYGKNFTCAVGKDNIYAVQFHPEKSHKFGMRLLQNFAAIDSNTYGA